MGDHATQIMRQQSRLEGVMRVLVAMLVAFGLLFAATGPVDAKPGAKAKKKSTLTYQQRKNLNARRFDPNDPKCIEAEALDPSGNYAGFPCWARAALSPKGDGGSWR